MRKIIVAGLAVFIGITTTRASLAQWTFETSKPTSSGPYAAENGIFAGTSKALAYHTGSGTDYSNPVGAGSHQSYNANTWSVGDFYQFTTSTLGHEDIQVSFESVSSSTGPKNFNLAYSTDGASFSVFSSYSLLGKSSSWSSSMSSASAAKYGYHFNLASIAGLDNQTKIYLRLIDNSTTSASGKTVGSSGTSRVDDFTISGNTIPSDLKTSSVPEPSTFFAGAFLGLPFLLSGIRRLRFHHLFKPEPANRSWAEKRRDAENAEVRRENTEALRLTIW